MKQEWEKWSTKFNSLSLRERGVIFFTVALIFVALFQSLALEPLISREQAAVQQITEIENKIQALRTEKVALINSASVDPDAEMKSRLAAAKERINEINNLLQDRRQLLISPDEITRVLEAILIQNRKLKLMTLNNLPIEPLVGVTRLEDQTDSSVLETTEATEQIYKHGVEITVQGKYLDLLAYLNELEKIPARMFWDHVSLRVDEYPSAILTLTVYTLSLDKAWLKV